MNFERQEDNNIETKIAEARSFEELYEVLVSEPSISSLQGQPHNTDLLVAEIKHIREMVESVPKDNIEEIPFLNLLTRAGGLRTKVAELLKAEKPIQTDEPAPESAQEGGGEHPIQTDELPPEPVRQESVEQPADNFVESAKLVTPPISEIELPTFIRDREEPVPDADKIKAGGAMEMPALKSDEEDEKKTASKPGFVKKYVNAIKAGIKGAKEGYKDKRSERVSEEADKKREKEIEKEAKKIEKEKGKEAADEFRRIRKGNVVLGVEKDKKESKKGEGKGWENMTEDERKEKYGKTFEIRERLIALRNKRANLAVLENEMNSRNSLMGRVAEKLGRGNKKRPLKDLPEQYKKVLASYEQARAEYIGAKTWRMLKEKKKAAEVQSEKYKGGNFEKLKRGWKWLGDQNVDKLLGKFGYEPKNRFVKILARMASLRTLTSLGLLGGGMAIGFGSSVGIGLIAARRVMGGLGTAFGSYDIMKLANEKVATSLNEKKIEKMSLPEIEEKMAQFEARAKFSGGRTVKNRDYDLLMKAYMRREVGNALEEVTKLKPGINVVDAIEEAEKAVREGKFRSKDDLVSKVQRLDEMLRKQEPQLTKEERHRKIAAVGIGLFSVGAFSAADIAKMIYGDTEFVGLTPEQIKALVHKGPLVTNNVIQDAAKSEGGASNEVLNTITEEKSKAIMGTVKQGGSISQAAWDIVRGGKITSQELASAWKSSASMVELPSGAKVHISELGLSHAGDQVVYVAANGGVPAHFEVVDYAADKFHIGNNADLAEAFKAEGRPIPRWLQEALGAEEGPAPSDAHGAGESVTDKFGKEIPKIKDFVKAPELKMQELSAESAETLRRAGLGLLEVSPDELKFNWGTAEFILDKEDGHIIDVFITDTASIELRPLLVEKAAGELLDPNYKALLAENLPEWPEDFKPEDFADPSENPEFVLAERVAIAEQSAWEVSRLKQVVSAMKNLTPSESFALNHKVDLLIKAKEAMLDVKIFKRP